jgi:hypothetical protein
MYEDWRRRCEQSAAERAKKQKQHELKQERETLARIKEGIKRRVY